MTENPDHTEHGDAAIARSGEILRTEVGSGLHGIAIAGTDDHDEMGVFIEPPECAVGLRGPMDHYVWRTQPEGHRSSHGDTDLVMYSLRKFLKLAIAGNPTILLPLFAPEASVYVATEFGAELRDLAPAFLSQHAVERFVGYLDGQTDLLLGRGRQVRCRTVPSWSSGTATTSSTPRTRSASACRASRSPSTPGSPCRCPTPTASGSCM